MFVLRRTESRMSAVDQLISSQAVSLAGLFPPSSRRHGRQNKRVHLSLWNNDKFKVTLNICVGPRHRLMIS